jgi:hypothetical protein
MESGWTGLTGASVTSLAAEDPNQEPEIASNQKMVAETVTESPGNFENAQ